MADMSNLSALCFVGAVGFAFMLLGFVARGPITECYWMGKWRLEWFRRRRQAANHDKLFTCIQDQQRTWQTRADALLEGCKRREEYYLEKIERLKGEIV